MRDEIRVLAKTLPVAAIKLERGAMKMNENTKELVAIGASLAAHCQPCLTFHVDKARKLGIGEDEINEAIAVGRMIRKGAMSAMDRFAESVVAAPENKPSPCCDNAAGNCCS
jgi:AhpD family alkylhydroperoxidase